MCYEAHVSIGFDYLAFFEIFVFSYRSNFKNMCFSVVIRVTKRLAKQPTCHYQSSLSIFWKLFNIKVEFLKVTRLNSEM